MGLLDKQHFYIEMGLLADKSIIKKYGLARTKTLALRLANLVSHLFFTARLLCMALHQERMKGESESPIQGPLPIKIIRNIFLVL